MSVEDVTGAWDYTNLPSNVRLGAGCFIERRASFRRYRSEKTIGLALGERVQVHACTEFSIEPQGVIEIGDDCVLAGAIFMCAERISLGDRVVVSYHVSIADSDFHPIDREERRRDAIANAPGTDKSGRPAYESRPIVIEDDVWIGIGAYILNGVRVGCGARVEAGAVVTRDVPAHAVIAGNPARIATMRPR